MFAFALAALNWMGATVSALWLLLPHPDGARVTPIIVATLAAYGLGVLLLAGSRPHPLWMFQAAIALDTLVISIALVATGDPGSEYAFYYLWATLYAVCFFNARQIALQGVWVCLAYALSLALIGERPAGALVAQWMLPMATLLAVGTLVRQLTGRLRRSEALLRHDAGHDALTGLPNRAHFDALLEDALVVGAPVAVAFIDLDDFKRVNDSLGHGAGDALLLAVAQRLRDAAADTTVIARFGGDEFLALIRGEAADAEARRLIESFAQPFLAGVHEVTVKASLGLAQARLGEDAETVLRHADTAVYEAKRAGRGRSATFDASMRAAISERLRLEHDLARALSNDELEVAYQPIVSLVDGSITGVEALARWTHPERGRVAPDVFIAVAEETGLIDVLGERVLAIACTDAVRWAQAIPGFRVSVNLSPRQLDTDAFEPMVIQTLARTGLSCRVAAAGGHRAQRHVRPAVHARERPRDRPLRDRARARRLRDRLLVAVLPERARVRRDQARSQLHRRRAQPGARRDRGGRGEHRHRDRRSRDRGRHRDRRTP